MYKIASCTEEINSIQRTLQYILTYKDKHYDLKAEVVKGKTPCLFGRNWLDVITMCWDEVFQIKTDVQSDVDRF